jgi:hypothetical protein
MALNPHYDKQLARTEPGGGAGRPDQGASNVKSKSIPNVPTEHLQRAQSAIHEAVHTPEGIKAHDGPRRNLIEQGVKGHMITHELHLRGEGLPDCQFCKKPGHYD